MLITDMLAFSGNANLFLKMFCFVLFLVKCGIRQTTCLKKKTIPDHELSWLKWWTWVRQSARSILSVFCWYYFLGPYLHWPFLLDYYFCWVVLFQGQCRPQVHTIWNALDFTTSITVWLRTFKRNLHRHADSSFNVRSFTLKKHAESKRWRNLLIMCITSGFLS